MKLKYLTGVCILILISGVSALEDSYPFLGRFVDQNDNGIRGLALRISFEECISKELITDADGEFLLVMNYEDDIVYKNDNLRSCVRDITNNQYFSILIESECGIEEYGKFKTGSSLAAVGTHKIESCIIEEDIDYMKPMPGGGGDSSKKPPIEDSFVIIGEDELKNFVKKIEEGKKQKNIIEEKPLLKRIGLPAISFSQNYIIMIFLLLLIVDLIVLIYHLKKQEQEMDKEF